MTERCGSCKFYRPEEEWVSGDGSQLSEFYGRCFRYPPQWIRRTRLADAHSRFPEVLVDQWCGEFKEERDVNL